MTVPNISGTRVLSPHGRREGILGGRVTAEEPFRDDLSKRPDATTAVIPARGYDSGRCFSG
jgi:hypothetical protein